MPGHPWPWIVPPARPSAAIFGSSSNGNSARLPVAVATGVTSRAQNARRRSRISSSAGVSRSSSRRSRRASADVAETTRSRARRGGALAFGRCRRSCSTATRSATRPLRHEVPLEIVDPFLLVARRGRPHARAHQLARGAPGSPRRCPTPSCCCVDELGLLRAARARACRATRRSSRSALRAVRRWGIEEAVVPRRPAGRASPTGCATAGIAVEVDADAVEARRAGQDAGRARGHPPRPARRRARAWPPPRRLIRGADARTAISQHDGEPLTAETVRAAIRADVRRRGRARAAGHHGRVAAARAAATIPGSGPLPAGLPIEHRPLAARRGERLLGRHDPHVRGNGEVTAEVAALRDVAREALEAARAAARPGVTGPRARTTPRADVVERAGLPDPAHARAGRDARPRLLLRARPRRRARGPRAARARPRRRRRRSSPAT